MQAVILAGGLGKRLKPLTEQIPKVLAPVNGRPFLQHLLELLRNQKIDDIILCTGYLGKQVRDLFGNGEDIGLNIRYSEEKEGLLGTGGALKQAQYLLDEHFFVINGDTYLPINYIEIAGTFFERGKKALMVVYDNREDTGVKNNVALDDDLMVIKYDKEGSNSSLKYVEAGVLALKQEALDVIKEGCSVSLEKGLYPTLIQQNQLAAYVTEQKFHDIGTLDQKKTFEEFLKSQGK